MKNILMTTLGHNNKDREMAYYVYDDDNGEKAFCNGVSVAEAGTKYILSQHKIDEIIVVSDSKAINNQDDISKRCFKDININDLPDSSGLSEYGFYQYRIKQYLEGKDIEFDSIINDVSDEFLKEHLAKVKEIEDSCGVRINGEHFMDCVRGIEPYYSKFKEMKSMSSHESFVYQCGISFSKIPSRYLMYPLEVNKNINVRFMEFRSNDIGLFGNEYEDVIKQLSLIQDDDIKLYIDLQGFDFGDAFSLYNVISILSESLEYKIELAGIIQSNFDPVLPMNIIKNEWKRYEIQKLLVAIYEFLNYGKSDELCKYWNKTQNKSKCVNDLLIGIKYVDEGVTFCNIEILRYGISIIKEAIENNDDSCDVGYILMKDLIVKDYGKMLEGEAASIPALLKWTVDKKMYQQALTIIESHVPSDLVNRGIFYYAKDDAEIDKVAETLNVLFWNEINRCRYVFSDIDHYMLKNYGRQFINNRQRKDAIELDLADFQVRRIHNTSEDVLMAYSDFEDEKMLRELLWQYYHIGNLRNQVCHASAPSTPGTKCVMVKLASNSEMINEVVDVFVKTYILICEKMNNKDYKVNRLDEERFRTYTSNHRLMPFETVSEGIIEQNCLFNYNGKNVEINIKMLEPEDDCEL